MESGEVSKGGITWLEIALRRNTKGIVLWVRANPMVEEFMKSLSGEVTGYNSFEDYGVRTWFPIEPATIRIYQASSSLDSPYYSIEGIGNSLQPSKGSVNLSFLRFEGVGSPEGVKFLIAGPMGLSYMKAIKDLILMGGRQLVRDYIVPVNINLRITSTEL